jgi:hypothetical protein
VIFAIMESDHTLKPYFAEIERCRLRLVDIRREIKRNETRVFFDSNNNKIEGDWAEKERNLMYDLLSSDLLKEEQMFQVHQQNLDKHVHNRRRRMGIRLEQLSSEGLADFSSWHLDIYGVDDAKDVENLLMVKTDLVGIRLATHSEAKGLPPWAGREAVPVGESSRHADYSGLEVRMGQARLMRVPHGVGVYRALDRASSSVVADKYALFYGEYVAGRRYLSTVVVYSMQHLF